MRVPVKLSVCVLALMLILFLAAEFLTPVHKAAAEFRVAAVSTERGLKAADENDITNARRKAWDFYLKQNRARTDELKSGKISHGEAVMRFTGEIIGEAGAEGYPLYIALHGGGATPQNEDQWKQMQIYYRESVKSGVYVAARGVRDTWDTHFNPESYFLYDRLIEDYIAAGVDPNRVYIMGYSAGGDGVYAVATRMGDRFAAASMSAGHANGVSLLNLANTPILIQMGERDAAYDRNRDAAQNGLKLDRLAEDMPGFYVHQTNLHVGMPHNFLDNDPRRKNNDVVDDLASWLKNGNGGTVKRNTLATDFLESYTRNPLPETVVWDLSVRAGTRQVDSWYWLNVPADAIEGIVIASFDRDENVVALNLEAVSAPVTVMLNEKMINLFKPVTVLVNGAEFKVKLELSQELLDFTTNERGDPNYQFVAAFVVEPD